MNAIANNEFSRSLNLLRDLIPKPSAILCVSAHWLTRGTFVTNSSHPRMIYDMQGFPDELYELKYPAPGAPDWAEKIKKTASLTDINYDNGTWGFDHGTWGVLTHVYPAADVPTLQLSLDMTKPASFHFQLGQQLAPLREEGLLILGSGNIVHNLRKILWLHDAPIFDWALQYDQWVKTQLDQRNFSALIEAYDSTEIGRLSVPTPDHYFPLLYAIGASHGSDKLSYLLDQMQNGSISMRSFMFYPV